MPCGEQGAGKAPRGAAMACCATMPAPSTAVVAETKRSAQIQPADPQSPDLFALTGHFDFPMERESFAPYLVASCEAPGCKDASLTYLRTSRLRL